MSLKVRISEDMKAALRARDADRLKAVRLLLAAIKQREVDERTELADTDVIAVIDKMLKQRRESIAQFEKGGRQDLVAGEQAEIAVLLTYMPQALSADEIERVVTEAIASTKASGPKDMGAVMAALRPRLAGRADMTAASQLVKRRLSV
ncbi:MAG: GatB/YqeY domain-containing protein [Burkholderiales bacterium]|nr:GatB/YqeY domain-containing protein [Burkholderiales bacterium]